MPLNTESEFSNDSTQLAGWVYADLLLGLMVVFLATISFKPIDNFANSTIVKSTYKQVDKGFNYNKGLSLVYSKFDIKVIDEDIKKFRVKENLGSNSQIIFAQILGGYDNKTEIPEDGRNRALLYSFKLQTDPSNIFKDAQISITGSPALKANEFAIRLTFVAKIK